MSDDSLFPEHDKLHQVKDQSQQIGEFLDWLHTKGIVLAQYPKDRVWPRPYTGTIERLLAEYFEVDLRKLEEEKLAMLWSIRNGLKIG